MSPDPRIDCKIFSPELTFDGSGHSGSHQGYYPLQRFEDEHTGRQSQYFGAEDMQGISDLWSGYGSNQENPFETGVPLPLSSDQIENSMEIEDFEEPIRQEEKASNSSSPSSGKNLSSNEERDPVEPRTELSTEEIMRVAAAHFIQLSAHPLGSSFAGLTVEEAKGVDLASLLLATAEKVSNQQFDQARELLTRCYQLSSSKGNPVQRVVYYFLEALKEKIDRDIGTLQPKRPREQDPPAQGVIKTLLITAHPTQLVAQEKIPTTQLMQITSGHTIIEAMASAKRIHIIDLTIRHGIHLTLLMQSLAARPTCHVEYLKVSAVGTSKEIAIAGKRLVSFAETLNLPFDFKEVIVSDMKDLKEDMFDVKEGEAVGVYSSMQMNQMIARPDSLENLMRVIQKFRPCIMIIMDFEAKHNSTSFINRFVEALFHYSAFFDLHDTFMDRDDSARLVMENFHSHMIKNIVGTEGSQRVARHVGVSMWRSFLLRFGIVETELSEWSQCQARLLVEQLTHGSSMNIHKNGKSLVLGWKGTPLVFVSAWKFKMGEGWSRGGSV